MKKLKNLLTSIIVLTGMNFTIACNNNQKVTIYTSTEDYNMENLKKSLEEKFPKYKIVIEYMSTSNIASKVIEEGEKSDCDIIYAEEYGYVEKMIEKGVLDSIKGDYNLDKYLADTTPDSVKDYSLPAYKTGGAIIINNNVLSSKGIEKPTSYEDLLDPKYKGLVSMASPKSSGTGYMFLYSLYKSWGESKVFDYFDKLTPNILSYTSSGSGPVNALVNREVAVGFGMISQAVNKINSGNKELELLFFKEGAPFNTYGNAIVKGKKSKTAVKEVMDYLDSYYTNESNKLYYPEPVLKDVDYKIANFPSNITYSDMTGNNLTNKEKILEKWKH